MAKEFKITSLRLAELEKELNYLKTTREREIAAMIAEARSYGDLSENSPLQMMGVNSSGGQLGSGVGAPGSLLLPGCTCLWVPSC